MQVTPQVIANRANRGVISLVLLFVVLVAALTVAGTGYYFYHRAAKPAAQAPGQDGAAETGQPAAGSEDEIGSLQINAPTFTTPSTSVLPDLQTQALNLSAANLPSKGIFKDFSANVDASYSYKLDIPMPEVELTLPEPTASEPAAPSAPTGGTGTGGTSGNSQSQPSAANCAQFSAMPSAQYCSAIPDPNGSALCRACKAAGF